MVSVAGSGFCGAAVISTALADPPQHDFDMIQLHFLSYIFYNICMTVVALNQKFLVSGDVYLWPIATFRGDAVIRSFSERSGVSASPLTEPDL
jgi:hypothetical protein